MRYLLAQPVLPVLHRSRVILGLAALALAVPADASKPRLRLERIDASSFEGDSTVRVFASVVELEGSVDDGRAAPSFLLKMNGKPIGRPEKSQQFQGAAEPLDLVLIVESSALYGPKKVVQPPPPPPAPKGAKAAKGKRVAAAPRQKGNKVARDLQAVPAGEEPLDKVKDAVHALLEGLSPRVRVLLIDYGAEMTAHTPFRPAASVSNDIDDLRPDGDAGDLALSAALHRALAELGKPRPDGQPARRLIAVVSDGLNSQMDRKTFKTLGDEAARARVPIHTIAFSPSDERGPLLNLGEVSKRSNGTFRWARTAEDLRAQIDTLTDELNKQYVLTYKIDARSLEGRTFQLTSEDLTSNPLTYDSSGGSFGYAAATRPLVPWWLWALAGIVLFGGAAAVLVVRGRPKKPMKFSPYKTGGPQPAPGSSATAAGRAATTGQSAPVTGQSGPVAQSGQAAQGHVTQSAPAARASAPTRGTLIVVSGALAGQRVEVSAQPISIGKGPATLQISDDPAVSTRHAKWRCAARSSWSPTSARPTARSSTTSGSPQPTRLTRTATSCASATPRSNSGRTHERRIEHHHLRADASTSAARSSPARTTRRSAPTRLHRTDKPSEIYPFAPGQGPGRHRAALSPAAPHRRRSLARATASRSSRSSSCTTTAAWTRASAFTCCTTSAACRCTSSSTTTAPSSRRSTSSTAPSRPPASTRSPSVWSWPTAATRCAFPTTTTLQRRTSATR